MASAGTLPTGTARYLASLGERIVRAFVVASVGVYLAALLAGSSSALSDATVLQKAAVAGLAAAANLLLGLLGKGVGDTSTPSLLPYRYDPASRPGVIDVRDERVAPPSSRRER